MIIIIMIVQCLDVNGIKYNIEKLGVDLNNTNLHDLHIKIATSKNFIIYIYILKMTQIMKMK